MLLVLTILGVVVCLRRCRHRHLAAGKNTVELNEEEFKDNIIIAKGPEVAASLNLTKPNRENG